MVAYENTVAGGVDGVDVTTGNSGGVSGRPFDYVNSTLGALTYDTRSGLMAIKADFEVPPTGGSLYTGWDLPGGLTRIAGRIELFLDEPLTSPDDAGRAFRYVEIVNSNITIWSTAQWRDSPEDPLYPIPTRLLASVGGTEILFSGDGVIPIGQWFRIEYDFHLTAPYGWQVAVYHSRTGTVADYAWSGNLASAPPAPTRVYYGAATFGSNQLWYRNVNVNDSGLPGPGPQPPAGPLMSTLTDAFPTIDPAKWTTIGPVSSVGGALQLGDDILTGYLTSTETYTFDRAQVRINVPGRGCALWVDSADSSDYLRIVVDPDNWTIRAEWFIGGASGASEGEPYRHEDHQFLRIERHTDTAGVAFLVSHDGLEWTALATWGVPNDLFTNARAILYGNLATSLDDFNILVPVPPEEPDDLPDPFDPDIEVPPIGVDPGTPNPAATCATLLQLIREFSAAVKRPVRIVGSHTIELVDINTPLPTGWAVADADGLYSRTSHELIAGERSMSTDPQLLALNVAADLVADDVRLVLSDWQLPHQLPVYGLAAALVKRVTYTFTPKHFTGSIEFHNKPVPASVRRR